MPVRILIMGGLGNQMFCYATGYAYAKRNKTDLVLDLSYFDSDIDLKYNRDYMLDVFGIEHPTIKNWFFKFRLYRYLGRTFLSKIRFGMFLYEADVNIFDQRVLNAHGCKDAFLQGYWQNDKYFNEFREDLLDIFTLKRDIGPQNRAILQMIQSSNSVCIHYRSYKEIDKKIHAAGRACLPLAYYSKAINHIEEAHADLTYFIFGDVDSPALNALLSGKKVINVDINRRKGAEMFDLFLMSQCRHAVLANSSFSWWAGWLSSSSNIYYPCRNGLYHYPAAPDSWYLLDWV